MQSTTAYGQPTGRESLAKECAAHDDLQPLRDLGHYFREYAKENPEVAALTCLSVGFILGWKLKMW